jgi:CheY-like chemotaxis protein
LTDYSKTTVMIVDDEEDLRDVIAFDIEDAGFKILTASSGNKAIELLAKHKVDIIVSDIRMPDGDGVSLLNSIRKTEPNLPVVFFVSAFADISESSAKNLGAKALLKKPINPDELISQLKASISN